MQKVEGFLSVHAASQPRKLLSWPMLVLWKREGTHYMHYHQKVETRENAPARIADAKN